MLYAVRIVTELSTVELLSTKYNGVFCKEFLRSKILNERSKNGPKNTIMYMTMIEIIFIVSLILLSLEDIYGGNMYSNCSIYFFFFSYSSSYSKGNCAYYYFTLTSMNLYD